MSVELLHQVRLIDPTSGTDRIVDVLLNDGHVRSVEPHITPPPEATIVEGQGKILGPGLVDLYSTVGEPGHEERETLESIAQAAAAGGFMGLNLLPNTTPAIDNPAQVQWMNARRPEACESSPTRPTMEFWGALTLDTAGIQMCEFAELATGVVGFGDGKAIALGLLRRILEYTQTLSKQLLLWMWDNALAGKGTMRDGVEALTFGLII